MKVDVGDFQMGIDRAIPCGLIINELVSNAMKHAFPNGRSGEIAIRLHADESDWITLTVAHDGVGAPPGLDLSKTESLGLQLVSLLCETVARPNEFKRPWDIMGNFFQQKGNL